MKSQCPEAGSPEETRMLQMPYRELVGTLLWIANGTRPDIAFAVTTLAKYTSNPCKDNNPTGAQSEHQGM